MGHCFQLQKILCSWALSQCLTKKCVCGKLCDLERRCTVWVMHRAQRVRRHYSIYIYRQRKNESSIKMIYFMYCKSFYLYEQIKKKKSWRHASLRYKEIIKCWSNLIVLANLFSWAFSLPHLQLSNMKQQYFKSVVYKYLIKPILKLCSTVSSNLTRYFEIQLFFSFSSRNMYFLSSPVAAYWNGHVSQRHQYGWEVSDQNTT